MSAPDGATAVIVRPATDKPNTGHATSARGYNILYFPTFGLSFFSRMSKEKVERIQLVFLKLGSEEIGSGTTCH